MFFTSEKREAELLGRIESQKAQIDAQAARIASLNTEIEALNSLKAKFQQINDDFAKLQIAHEKLQQAYARASETRRNTSEQTETPKPAAVDDSVPTPAPVAQVDLAPLTERLDKLADLQEVNARKDEIIKDMHAEIQSLSRGVFDKFAKPFLSSIIRIYTHLAEEIDSARREFFETGSKEAETFYKRMDTSLQMVEDTLQDEFDAIRFTPVPGDTYEPRAHYAVKTINTDDTALAGTISVCRQSGFKNADDGKIIKQATVIVYRLTPAAATDK